MMHKNNYDLIDLIKLISAYAVVAIHAELLGDFIYPYVRLAVPIFFICTGYFTFIKLDSISTKKEKIATYKKTVKRYLALYLFWFTIMLPYTVYVRGYYKKSSYAFLKEFIKDFVFGSTFRASWYIMACIIGISIIFRLSFIMNNRTIIIVTLPFYIFATFCSELQMFYKEYPMIDSVIQKIISATGLPYTNFMVSLIYIVIGREIVTLGTEKIKNNRYKYLIFSILSAILLFAEYNFLSYKNYLVFNCDCYFSLVICSSFIVLFALGSEQAVPYAKTIRKISTITYFIHIPMISVYKIIFKVLKITDINNVLLFITVVVSSFIISNVIIYLREKKRLKILMYAI